MAVHEIAVSFKHVCDSCGKAEASASKSRPKYWTDLHILRDAYDYSGAAVADGSVKLLLCLECGAAITKAINEIADAQRAMLAAAPSTDEGSAS